MIVDSAKYINGIREPVGDLGDELSALRRDAQHPSFLWIGLKNATSEEFRLVTQELKLHPLAVEDVVTGNQRAKLELYDGSLFAVLKTLRYVEDTSDIETGEVMAFLGDRFFVTIREGEANPLRQVRQRLEQAPHLLRLGPKAALYAVIDSVVDNYVVIAEELQRDLEEIEEAVFAGDRAVDSGTIYRLKREVLEFKRAAMPLVRPLSLLAERSSPFPEKELRLLFRDVYDHLRRVIDSIESFDRLLTDVLSAHLARVGVRQNEDMRKISAWVAIAAMPTMIAGIYGMNFEHMPELHWRFGYALALLLMVSVCGVLYRLFRRSGWL